MGHNPRVLGEDDSGNAIFLVNYIATRAQAVTRVIGAQTEETEAPVLQSISRTANFDQGVTRGDTLSWDLDFTNNPRGIDTNPESSQFEVRAIKIDAQGIITAVSTTEFPRLPVAVRQGGTAGRYFATADCSNPELRYRCNLCSLPQGEFKRGRCSHI